jgi:hypothetical protein
MGLKIVLSHGTYAVIHPWVFYAHLLYARLIFRSVSLAYDEVCLYLNEGPLATNLVSLLKTFQVINIIFVLLQRKIKKHRHQCACFAEFIPFCVVV